MCDHAPLVRAWDHSDVGRWEQEAADGAHERLNMAMFSIVCLCGVYCLLSASILALTVRAVSSFCSHMSVCVYVRCCICDTFCFHPFLLSNSLVLREAQFRAEIFFVSFGGFLESIEPARRFQHCRPTEHCPGLW